MEWSSITADGLNPRWCSQRTSRRAHDSAFSWKPLLLPPTQPGATPCDIPASLESFYVKSIRMGEVEVLYDRLRLTSQNQGPLTIVIGTIPELSAVEFWMIATNR